MIGSILDEFWNGLFWGLRQAISVLRHIGPPILRVLLSAMGLALQLSVLSFLAFHKGIPYVARRAAEDWSAELIERRRFPPLHQLTLTKILLWVAYAAIYTGFLVNLFTVVFMVDLGYMWWAGR